jgi:hypothetical protein
VIIAKLPAQAELVAFIYCAIQYNSVPPESVNRLIKYHAVISPTLGDLGNQNIIPSSISAQEGKPCDAVSFAD